MKCPKCDKNAAWLEHHTGNFLCSCGWEMDANDWTEKARAEIDALTTRMQILDRELLAAVKHADKLIEQRNRAEDGCRAAYELLSILTEDVPSLSDQGEVLSELTAKLKGILAERDPDYIERLMSEKKDNDQYWRTQHGPTDTPDWIRSGRHG